jgi:hypothetical protein
MYIEKRALVEDIAKLPFLTLILLGILAVVVCISIGICIFHNKSKDN